MSDRDGDGMEIDCARERGEVEMQTSSFPINCRGWERGKRANACYYVTSESCASVVGDREWFLAVFNGRNIPIVYNILNNHYALFFSHCCCCFHCVV